MAKVRELFLSDKYPKFQLARFIIDKDDEGSQEPDVVDNIRESIPDVTALHELLMSDKMYGNMEVYDRWCRAMESGVLRGTYKKNNTPQRLEDSISPWHEAHFRLPTSFSITPLNFKNFSFCHNLCSVEVWFILSRKNARHFLGKAHVEERASNFLRMYKHVRNDRAKNGANAWAVRRAQLNLDGAPVTNIQITTHGGVNFDDIDSY